MSRLYLVFSDFKMHFHIVLFPLVLYNVEKRCHDPGFVNNKENQVQVCKITWSGNDKLHVKLSSQRSCCMENVYNFHKGSGREELIHRIH